MPLVPMDFSATKQESVVYKLRRNKTCRNGRSTFDHQPGNALLGQRLHHLVHVELSAAFVDAKNLTAFLLENFLGNRRRARGSENPGWRFTHRCNHRCRQRDTQLRIEYDADRRALEQARKPACQLRVICQYRANTYENSIACGAHLESALARRVTGDGSLLAAGKPRLAVGRDCEFQCHIRPAPA